MPEMISIFDIDPAKALVLQQELNVHSAREIGGTIESDTDILILAVKPQIIGGCHPFHSRQDSRHAGDHLCGRGHFDRFHSFAPQLPRQGHPGHAQCCGYGRRECYGSVQGRQRGRWRSGEGPRYLFRHRAGVTVEEKMMNVVTALSGSGPGYLFPIMEASD